jgi:uracil-DNA glycosylase
MPESVREIRVDRAATRRRLRRLSRYVEDNVLRDGKFICPSYRVCRSSRSDGDVFREGTMSHLGLCYDLFVGDKPLRVVVVGQESGWPGTGDSQTFAKRVSLDSRYQQVHDGSGLGRRYYAQPGHPGRNPHMRGTTSALRVLLGKGLGADHDDEFVHPLNGRRFHLFDGFALVNRLLCSAGPPDSSTGHPTRTMFTNCAAHFRATISILQPTIMVVQGKTVAKQVNAVLPPVTLHSNGLHEASLAGARVLVCSFTHPSAHRPHRWGDRLDSPYLTDVVVPTLARAVQLL